MVAPEFAPNDLTPAGIPISLRPAFQEFQLEELDPELDAFTVMERTLGRGDMLELRWLFRKYGLDMLRAFVEKYGLRFLPRPRMQYWTLYFALPMEIPQDRIWKH